MGRTVESGFNFINKFGDLLGDSGAVTKLLTLACIIDAVSVDSEEFVLALLSNTTAILTLGSKEITFGNEFILRLKYS